MYTMKRTTNNTSTITAGASPRRGIAARIAGRSALAACAAAALALGSCTESPDEGLPGGDRVISISTVLGGANDANAANRADKATRAPVADGGEGACAALADMHFLRKDGATTQTDFSGVTALTASRSVSGAIAFAADGVPTYDKNNLNAWFTAYWPATAADGAAVTAGEKVVWTVDGSRDILLSTLDPAASFDAGKYTAPGTGAMPLEHVLAQLQVVCTADASVAESVVRQTWGKVTKIEILSSPATATYTYANNTLSYGAVAAMPLWTADYSAKFEGRSHELTKNTTAVTAAGMYPPGTGVVRLKVCTEKAAIGTEVSIQLADAGTNKDFERGLTHTVTLTFGAQPKEITVTGTTITAWAAGYGNTTNVGGGQQYDIPAPSEGFLYWNHPDVVTSGVFSFFEGSAWITPTYSISGPGAQSYNSWQGTVAGGSVDGGNGRYWSSSQMADLLANEKPYPKLEVAKEDEKISMLDGVETMFSWATARNMCRNKTTDGGGWRLPRMSELMWMYLNRTELEKTPGFVPFDEATEGCWWSATEAESNLAWYVCFTDGSIATEGMSYIGYHIRCVREIHPPMPSPRDYYYSDGSTSTTLDASKTAEGIVIWVDPADPAHFKVISLKEPENDLAWSTSTFDIGVGDYAGIRYEATYSSHDLRALARQSGEANRGILGRWLADPAANTTGKTINDFPAFKFCDEMGEGWYLPAVNESQYFMCTVYGVAPVTWADTNNFTGLSYEAFSTLRTAAGGAPYSEDLSYTCSTEEDNSNYWTIYRDTSVDTSGKTYRTAVRCVKEIQPL